jgi:hypothetical protein
MKKARRSALLFVILTGTAAAAPVALAQDGLHLVAPADEDAGISGGVAEAPDIARKASGRHTE